MPRKKVEKVIAVIDYETDPFKYGRVPKPFVCGFYYAGFYKEFWGDDCVLQLVDWLNDQNQPYLIYAHNGGKFDFFLMLEHLENPLKIINGRIVKAKLGIHELRDSYAIIPIPLADNDKGKINYDTFEREQREFNRPAISEYLRRDCVSLFGLVRAFWDRFHDRLTIGTTAIKKLREFHPFDSQFEGHDKRFRPYYFGGRVEAFEKGVLPGQWEIYDVNSMYPYVMKSVHHPTGNSYKTGYDRIIDKKGRVSGFADYPMFFSRIECEQNGAFPTRVKNESLDFNVPWGEFYVTSHELQAALETGRVQRIKILEIMAPEKIIQFGEYVDTYMAEKIRAKKENNKHAEIFAKLLLNSAYGKFGQSPDHYFDFYLQQENDDAPEEPYEIFSTHEGGINVWRKPSPSKRYFDVATAASVTGAARAVLLRGIAAAERVVYCDTDSIICERFHGETDNSALGHWKLEGRGNSLAIAGKKLYALRFGNSLIKSASKGVRFTDKQIFELARGGIIEWKNDAPSFSLNQPPRFVHRKIQSTNRK